jgi:uncharacterized membrane protein
MQHPRVFYKDRAKDLLAGNYAKPIVAMLIFGVVDGILVGIHRSVGPKYDPVTMQLIEPGNQFLMTILSLGQFLLSAGIVYSFITLWLTIVREKEIRVDEVLLSGFKEQYGRNLVTHFMRSLFIVLWSLLFVIPGLIKAYSYAMAFYLLKKNPGMDALESISTSKKLMDGRKADLFMLDLSYIGWYLLGILTLGILWLWIIPRHQTARMLYFEEIDARPETKVSQPDPLGDFE